MTRGRPTIYSEDLVSELCKRRESASLLQVCKSDDMPTRATVYNWLGDEDKKDFLDKYDLAQKIHSEKLFDELLDIADDSSDDRIENAEGRKVANNELVARSRLRVDTRKWYLSKVLPKKFGERIDITTGGEKISNGTLTPELAAISNEFSEKAKGLLLAPIESTAMHDVGSEGNEAV